MELPYSYHTFIFPFIWDNGQKPYGKKNRDNFGKVSPGKHWYPTNWGTEVIPEDTSPDGFLQNYAVFQYFNSYARNLIFGTAEDSLVRNFEFRLDDNQVKKDIIGEYIIKHGKEKFVLSVRSIKLKLVNNGVGILYFQLEYYGDKYIDEKKESGYDIKDVNKINEYGRRINLPFISTSTGDAQENSHPLVADIIRLVLHGKENLELVQDFKELNQKYLKDNNKPQLIYVPPFIKDLFNLDDISPALDDRMFVCCLVRDDFLGKRIKGENGEYEYLSECHDPSEESISNVLYTFAFIEESPSCQNVNMKRSILEKSIYARWIEWGTIHGVTHHSLICVTGEDKSLLAPVIVPFFTQYIQMAILALLQRVSLLKLSKMAGNTANSFKGNGEISSAEINNILALHEEYVCCQNQILLFEVTSQEQGIEIFELFLEQLYIEREKNALETQLNNLYEIASGNYERLNLRQDKILNVMVMIIAVASVVIALLQLLC